MNAQAAADLRSARELALAELAETFGDSLSTSAAVRDQHGRDESYHAVQAPDAVFFA